MLRKVHSNERKGKEREGKNEKNRNGTERNGKGSRLAVRSN